MKSVVILLLLCNRLMTLIVVFIVTCCVVQDNQRSSGFHACTYTGEVDHCNRVVCIHTCVYSTCAIKLIL